MTFALPQIKAPAAMTPRLVSGYSEPTTGDGGVVQRFQTAGAGKYAVDVKFPPMDFADASALVGALLRAAREEVTMKWYTPGLTIGAPGARTVSALTSANATVLPVAGGAAYVVRPLQFFNVVGPDGRLYLHASTQANEIPGSLIIAPALRVEATAGMALDFATPKIQGWVQGKDTPWTVDTARHYGVSFTIMEAR